MPSMMVSGIHETSYPQRSERYEELEIEGIKVDYFDAKRRVIHEIKRSDKIERAHEWQLKYYIYVFERNGIEGCTGLLEYPTLRQTQPVTLSDADREEIKKMEQDIIAIISSDTCPPLEKKRLCKACSYYDFCFTSEPDEQCSILNLHIYIMLTLMSIVRIKIIIAHRHHISEKNITFAIANT